MKKVRKYALALATCAAFLIIFINRHRKEEST